jgi:molecular chaperone DnaK (HSP70)
MKEPASVGQEARFSVGIDLGTTHCVLSYLDLKKAAEDPTTEPELTIMSIPQLNQPGLIEEQKQLPSFIYLPCHGMTNPMRLSALLRAAWVVKHR